MGAETGISHRQTLEQQRAAAAWSRIEEIQAKPGKYRAQVRKLPSLILTNGLGQALAFLKAKKQHDLYNHVSLWVTSQVCDAGATGDYSLLNYVCETDSDTYRRMTTEALAYLIWLKRFAEAELPDTGDEDDQ